MKQPNYEAGIWVGEQALKVLIESLDERCEDKDGRRYLSGQTVLADALMVIAGDWRLRMAIVRFGKNIAPEIYAVSSPEDIDFDNDEEFEDERDKVERQLRLGGSIYIELLSEFHGYHYPNFQYGDQ